MLENSHNCEDQDVRNKYDAITRFFRAYFYFKKVQRFGDVPWYDKVLDSSDAELLYKPRDSREFVMQKIIEDLDFAITTLSKDKELYRVSKWAALALKSRVCLFEGTFRKYHGIADYEKYLDACITASDDFMKNSGYSLYKTGSTPYQTLFSSLNAIQQEIVLARDYNGTLNIRHDVQGFENTASKGRPGLSKKIVNMYLNKNGSRFTDMQGYATKVFFDECQNRDPRLAQTIRTPGYIRPGETKQSGPNFSSAMTGYHLIKYSGATKYDVGDTSENDFPIFRTAEVFLNYVEAKAERGTLEHDGKYIINLDSDGMLEKNALVNMITRFENDTAINCMTGSILTVPEQIMKYKAGPSRLLRELEFMEYAQAFLAGRSYASELNSVYTLSGAFSAFRKSAVLKSWMYNTDTICEDTHITFQMRYLQKERVEVCEDALFFVDPIENVNKLYTQRQRWQSLTSFAMSSPGRMVATY